MFVTVQGQRKNLLAASTKRWIGCLIGSMTPFNEQLKTVTRFVIKNIPPTGSWNEWHTNVTLQWKRCCINCDILKWFYLGSMNKSLIQLHAERRKLLQHKSDKQTAGFGPCGQNKELSICSFCWENTWLRWKMAASHNSRGCQNQLRLSSRPVDLRYVPIIKKLIIRSAPELTRQGVFLISTD